MMTIEHPPELQVPRLAPPNVGVLSAGLDYYKPTMSQLQQEKYPDVEVTFTFHNRGQQRLVEYVDPNVLQDRCDEIRERGWSQSELKYLGSLANGSGKTIFTPDYLTFLDTEPLPLLDVNYDDKIGDIVPQSTGPWPLVTMWETVVMSEVSEAYYKGYMQDHGINPTDVLNEGDRRLSEKIAYFQANPDIKFSDFGTRRHFSPQWHEHVVERLAAECPDNFMGTSNVSLSDGLSLKPIGTFAHEMPMVYAAIADATGQDIRSSHGQMLDDLYDRYGDILSVAALSDTFGSDFFFDSLTTEQAKNFKSTRQDSGDAITYGKKAIEYYQQHGIDPQTKTVVFSNSLDIPEVDRIHRAFKGRLGHVFGIGTKLTNDLGIKPLNIVMKATHVRLPATGQEANTVKLSDDAGKHTGSAYDVARYQKIFAVDKT